MRPISKSERIGISIKAKGIGDGVQFSSLPENYFRATGRKLWDLSEPWFFDHNPFVLRKPDAYVVQVELWNFSPKQWDWPLPPRDRNQSVYLSNAEIWASLFGVPVRLSRPRLYFCESFPFEKRERILLHTHGRSHGTLPDHIVEHVKRKYGETGQLFHVGTADDPSYGLPTIRVKTLWELAEEISRARMFIGPDSGPSWIAACYPDVITKIVRLRPTPDVLQGWVPLERENIHSHWDDRCRLIYNPTENDIGFSWSYERI